MILQTGGSAFGEISTKSNQIDLLILELLKV
jgi:hypothetical protein